MLNRTKDLIELLREWRGFDMMWDAMGHQQRAEMKVSLRNFLIETVDDIERRKKPAPRIKHPLAE